MIQNHKHPNIMMAGCRRRICYAAHSRTQTPAAMRLRTYLHKGSDELLLALVCQGLDAVRAVVQDDDKLEFFLLRGEEGRKW